MKLIRLTNFCFFATLLTTLTTLTTSVWTIAAYGSEKLADGIYLIERSAPKQNDLYPLSATEQVLIDDGQFLEPDEREPITFLVLDSKDAVPFKLSTKPVEDNEQTTGKPRLQIQFAPAQATALAKLTGTNVGRRAAVVIDGKIVTCHKIREAITGGKLQITRCTRHHCDLIYSELLKDI